jgi:adenylate cyclase
VNTASRLEGLTKQYAAQIIISESTLNEIGDEFYVREVDHVRLKGKTRPVGIYEVLGDASYQPTAEQRLFVTGYEAYCQREFDTARAAFFAGAKSDALCGIFLTRCDEFLKSPPPAEWDGVWRMATK